MLRDNRSRTRNLNRSAVVWRLSKEVGFVGIIISMDCAGEIDLVQGMDSGTGYYCCCGAPMVNLAHSKSLLRMIKMSY